MKEEKPTESPAQEKGMTEAIYDIAKSLQINVQGLRVDMKSLRTDVKNIESEMREGQARTDNNFTMLYGMFSDHEKILHTMVDGIDIMRGDIHDIRGNVRFLLGEYSDQSKRIAKLEHEI